MADYHPLIARAVDGLGSSTGEARRALYERARAALVAQLRSIEPPLSEADITRERLALEDAIRKVEAETVRKARTEPRPTPLPTNMVGWLDTFAETFLRRLPAEERVGGGTGRAGRAGR